MSVPSKPSSTPPLLLDISFASFADFVEGAGRKFDGDRIFVETTRPLGMGQRVVLEVRQGQENRLIRALASVTGIRNDPSRAKGVDLEILYLDPAAQRLLSSVARRSRLPRSRASVPEEPGTVGGGPEEVMGLKALAEEFAELVESPTSSSPDKAENATPAKVAPVSSSRPAASPSAAASSDPDAKPRPPQREPEKDPVRASVSRRPPPIDYTPPPPSVEKSGGILWGAIVGLVLLAGAAFWFLGRGRSPEEIKAEPAVSQQPVDATTGSEHLGDSSAGETIPQDTPGESVGEEAVLEAPRDHVPEPAQADDAPPDAGPSDTTETPSEPLAPPGPSPEERIEETLRAWAAAWQEQDVATYLAAYGEGFVPPRGTRETWETSRQKRIARPEWIRIEITDLEIEVDGHTATTRFDQGYESPTYSDRVRKALIWEEIDTDVWRIVQEASLE